MEVHSPSSVCPTGNTRSVTAPAGLYALGVLAKDNVFAGRMRLDFRLDGLQISNGFQPIRISRRLSSSECRRWIPWAAPLCDKSSKLTGILCGSRALPTDVRCEFLVAPLFVMNLHLVNRFANGRPERIKHPCAFGASPALKILSFGPYQFETHRLHDTPRDVVGYATLKVSVALVSTALRRQSCSFHWC